VCFFLFAFCFFFLLFSFFFLVLGFKSLAKKLKTKSKKQKAKSKKKPVLIPGLVKPLSHGWRGLAVLVPAVLLARESCLRGSAVCHSSHWTLLQLY